MLKYSCVHVGYGNFLFLLPNILIVINKDESHPCSHKLKTCRKILINNHCQKHCPEHTHIFWSNKLIRLAPKSVITRTENPQKINIQVWIILRASFVLHYLAPFALTFISFTRKNFLLFVMFVFTIEKCANIFKSRSLNEITFQANSSWCSTKKSCISGCFVGKFEATAFT